MQLSTGIDLIKVERVHETIERHGRRFLDRVFTAQEQAECVGKPASLAARFAAKEACAKALGTGIGAVGWLEIEVVSGRQRRPELQLHGAAARLADELGLQVWSLSLSHDGDYAIAVVTALGG
jgi:holo-[acyl-carrier protein] synthase